MSVIVTGGAGYIGSHVVLALIEAGESVTILDDFSSGLRSAVPRFANLVEGDVGNRTLVMQLIRESSADAIIHLAGSVDVAHSMRDPLCFYLNNTCKSRTLIECAVKAGLEHFVFSSTAAVYGTPQCNPVNEEAELKPISPYGRSKLMTEVALSDAATISSLRYVALRYFNVAGADPKGRVGQSTPKASHLIKLAAQTALGQRPNLEIFGTDYPTPDGSCIRDYVHVHDLAPAHLAALAHLRGGGSSQILNCGYGRGYSVLDVVASVERVSGREIPIRSAPRRAGDPSALIADATKIGALLAWQPRFNDLDRIVGDTLAWERRLALV